MKRLDEMDLVTTIGLLGAVAVGAGISVGTVKAVRAIKELLRLGKKSAAETAFEQLADKNKREIEQWLQREQRKVREDMKPIIDWSDPSNPIVERDAEWIRRNYGLVESFTILTDDDVAEHALVAHVGGLDAVVPCNIGEAVDFISHPLFHGLPVNALGDTHTVGSGIFVYDHLLQEATDWNAVLARQAAASNNPEHKAAEKARQLWGERKKLKGKLARTKRKAKGGFWRTTEGGHRIYIENGKITKGNPHVIGKRKDEDLEEAQGSEHKGKEIESLIKDGEWNISIRKSSRTQWGEFITNPQGGGGGSSSTLTSANKLLARTLRRIPNGANPGDKVWVIIGQKDGESWIAERAFYATWGATNEADEPNYLRQALGLEPMEPFGQLLEGKCRLAPEQAKKVLALAREHLGPEGKGGSKGLEKAIDAILDESIDEMMADDKRVAAQAEEVLARLEKIQARWAEKERAYRDAKHAESEAYYAATKKHGVDKYLDLPAAVRAEVDARRAPLEKLIADADAFWDREAEPLVKELEDILQTASSPLWDPKWSNVYRSYGSISDPNRKVDIEHLRKDLKTLHLRGKGREFYDKAVRGRAKQDATAIKDGDFFAIPQGTDAGYYKVVKGTAKRTQITARNLQTGEEIKVRREQVIPMSQAEVTRGMRLNTLHKRASESIDEVSPPGFKGTVKAMKKHDEIDNPYALAWWMKKRGAKSTYKADGTKKESRRDDFSSALETDEALDEGRYRLLAELIGDEAAKAAKEIGKPTSANVERWLTKNLAALQADALPADAGHHPDDDYDVTTVRVTVAGKPYTVQVGEETVAVWRGHVKTDTSEAADPVAAVRKVLMQNPDKRFSTHTLAMAAHITDGEALVAASDLVAQGTASFKRGEGYQLVGGERMQTHFNTPEKKPRIIKGRTYDYSQADAERLKLRHRRSGMGENLQEDDGFAVVRGDGASLEYWTGKGWTDDKTQARFFTSQEESDAEVERLTSQEETTTSGAVSGFRSFPLGKYPCPSKQVGSVEDYVDPDACDDDDEADEAFKPSTHYKVVNPEGVIVFEGSAKAARSKLKKLGPGHFIGMSYRKKVGDKWKDAEDQAALDRDAERDESMGVGDSTIEVVKRGSKWFVVPPDGTAETSYDEREAAVTAATERARRENYTVVVTMNEGRLDEKLTDFQVDITFEGSRYMVTFPELRGPVGAGYQDEYPFPTLDAALAFAKPEALRQNFIIVVWNVAPHDEVVGATGRVGANESVTFDEAKLDAFALAAEALQIDPDTRVQYADGSFTLQLAPEQAGRMRELLAVS